MIEELRIADAQEIEGKRVGEIQIKGEKCIAWGISETKRATSELFTEDGWMKTGDLGYIEKQLCVPPQHLVGPRAMLLGPNGQNIYPEEIEAKIAMLFSHL